LSALHPSTSVDAMQDADDPRGPSAPDPVSPKKPNGHDRKSAVDPSGHLVMLAPGSDLPDDNWRWATEEDLEYAARHKAELDRREEQGAPQLVDRPAGGPLKLSE
jgi:hypothetical protein